MRLALLLALLATSVPTQDLSVLVPMKDGTRLAVDVHLPPGRAEGERFPALLELTRYWRSREDARTKEPVSSLDGLDRYLLEAGYAVLKVDERGSGASFGTRGSEYGQQEVRDGSDVVEWVVHQPWCDGKVGAYGISYSGTTAELLTATRHPAIRAVVVGWPDLDVYRSPAWPYGLHAASLIDEWSAFVGRLDRNETARLGASVRRVDADVDGELLRAAVAEHAGNIDVAKAVRAAECRDQKFGRESYADTSALRWKNDIEASAVPMLVLASWLDSGTAEAALLQFQRFSNPQKLVILASNHGGEAHASPYLVSRNNVAPRPTLQEQMELRRAFFDHHLKGKVNDVEAWPAIRYYNLGAESFLETNTWPPAGTQRQRYYLASDSYLAPVAETTAGVDHYAVDFGVSTGKSNCWGTQMGRPVLGLDAREEMDERMLVYTGAPLEQDLQITGTPVVHLWMSADRDDCAVLVYLEDVEPDGRSRYVTEGGLRAVHRKLEEHPPLDDGLPQHSFAQADRLPLVPGETAELVFRLHPTSVRLRAGHALRLAIAGADADTFARVPSSGDVSLEIRRGSASASCLELPVVPVRAPAKQDGR